MSTVTMIRPQLDLDDARALRPALRPVTRPAPRSSGELRLTRRGRAVVLVLALAAIFAVGLTLSATSMASDSSEGFPTRVITVAPGDTLWEIAGDVPGSDSTRSKVTTIERLNGLDGGSVQAGQRLVIPLQ